MPSLKARKKAAALASIMGPYDVKKQKRQLKRMTRRSNPNSSRARFQVLIDNVVRMSGTAKRIAPFVSQLTGIPALAIEDKLSNNEYHTFGNGVVVSLIGTAKGEGVLDFLTKKIGESSIFKSKPTDAPSGVTSATSQIKASFPADTKTLYQMNNNVYADKRQDVGDWKWMSGSKFLQFYMKGNNVIVAVRGTADLRDLMADVKIMFQNVQGSGRFKEDVANIRQFQQQFPRPQYNYYFTGHSLGGALIDEYLKMGFGTSAISFNPAVQKEYYNSFNHHRIYNTQDPLYDLMGKHVPSAEVRQYQGEAPSMMGKILSYVPIIGDATKALKGHSLDNYIGGQMKSSFEDRPFQRPLLNILRPSTRPVRPPPVVGGNWFMDNIVNPVNRVAVPAISLGTLTQDDLARGNLKPDFSKMVPYVTKTGTNLAMARMGDPSGLIGQVTGQMKGKSKCRWEEREGRYGNSEWVEVCGSGRQPAKGKGYYYTHPKHGQVFCANCD